jgi:hypothetical protein
MESAPTAHLLSLDARRRNNVAYVEDDVLVMAAGNNVVFLKLPNMVSGGSGAFKSKYRAGWVELGGGAPQLYMQG